MVRIALVALIAAGCNYSASFTDCTVKCTASLDCPEGLTCDENGLCRASIGAASCTALNDGRLADGDDRLDGNGDDANQDLDGDGVPNATDNCLAVANASQANEDGDSFGDLCDPCPPYTDNSDADGDGVGDACDPNPNASASPNHLRLFEGFHAAPPWTMSGTWTTSGDAIQVNAGSGAATLSTPAPSARETVSASVTVIASNAGGVPSIGVVDASISCRLMNNVSGTMPVVQLYDVSGQVQLASSAYEMTAGATYVVRQHRIDGAFTCDVGRGPTTKNVNGSATPSGTALDMRVFSAQARYQWIMVVTDD